MFMRGLDISDYQGVIEWEKLKAAGVQFAIMRTTRKSGNADHYLKRNMEECLRLGIPFDFYKYGMAVTVVDSILEATRVIEVLKGYGVKPSKDVVVFYDVEGKEQLALSTEQLTEIIQAFKDAVEDAGFSFGLYMGQYQYGKGEVDLSVLGEVHNWLARYYKSYEKMDFAEEPDQSYAPVVLVGKLQGWQYTSSGQIDGIEGNVDFDVAYYEIKDTEVGETIINESAAVREAELRQRLLDIVTSWLGFNEKDGSHRAIIDLYNSQDKLPRGYKVRHTDSWCATTVTAAGVATDLTDIIPPECSCGEQIKLFQKMNRWIENDEYIPEPADVIYYDWDAKGEGDCTGWPEHVGVVVSVDRSTNTILVIEGNKNDAVEYREIKIGDKYIRGYGIPDYASKANTTDAPTQSDTPTLGNNVLCMTPQWVGKVDANSLYVRKWAGKEYDTLASYPIIGKKVEIEEVEVCDQMLDKNGDVWYYIRINGKTYGFASAKYIKKTEEDAPEIGVGDVVKFVGSKHYTSSYENAKSRACKAGEAKVTAINPTGAHPYHLVRVAGSAATVYGWVDSQDIQ